MYILKTLHAKLLMNKYLFMFCFKIISNNTNNIMYNIKIYFHIFISLYKLPESKN
jgi:hypothetical protein